MQLLWGSGCCVALWAPAVLVQRRRHVSRGTPHFQLCFLQGPRSFLRKGPGVCQQTGGGPVLPLLPCTPGLSSSFCPQGDRVPGGNDAEGAQAVPSL